MEWPALAVLDQGGRQVPPADVAILGDVTLLRPVDRDLALPESFYVVPVDGAMLRMRHIEEGQAIHFFGGIPQHPTKRGIGSEKPEVAAGQDHPDGSFFKDLAEPLLALPQRFLGLLARGHVAVDARIPPEDPVFPEHRHPAGLDGD